MNANLLIVSSEDFPNPLFQQLERMEFTCHYSRGVLKTREILNTKQIDAIVWLFIGSETALGKDLANVFNIHPGIPIVFITQNYEHLDFAEDVKALFANLDLNDELADIIHTIETACNQSIIKEQEPEVDETHEIEFRNIVSQVFSKSTESQETAKSKSGSKLQQVELWEAVDKNEKQILAGKSTEDETVKKSGLPNFKRFLKKT